MTKSYPGTDTILDNLSFDVEQEEILGILGPNGSGKTTLLNIIAGLDDDFDGDIHGFRNSVGFVFQDFSQTLMPWKSVIDNLGFALRASGISKAEAREKVANFLGEFPFSLPLMRFPYQLSSGQRQLVVLLRTLIQRPSIFLLDEAFTALDERVRLEMQREVPQRIRSSGARAIVVSHDVDELIKVSDRIIIFSPLPARIVQTVEVPFDRPRPLDLPARDDFMRLRRSVVSKYLEMLR